MEHIPKVHINHKKCQMVMHISLSNMTDKSKHCGREILNVTIMINREITIHDIIVLSP